MMMDTPSICDWDGCGMPPDGGEYRQIGEGGQAFFYCEMCNREGNWGHVNAEPHMKNLKHYLCVTGQWHLLPSARPNGLTTQPAPDGHPIGGSDQCRGRLRVSRRCISRRHHHHHQQQSR